ncbi:trehalase family glycosidase [Mucilaginibacter sp. PAMB04274]|uniref:alpha-L-rhamnosidase-related protein n=1 Tax=Mucilaginibacter sp. PAMB04274 TaxID=3138568 RepID=UPI0031F65176
MLSIKYIVTCILACLILQANLQAQSNVIYQTEAYTLYRDSVVQANFTARALSATQLTSNYKGRDKAGKYKETLATAWKLSKDISSFPQYQSEFPIINAIYNLSLEEMQNAVEPDSTFRTGKSWKGVWTRDISYSIILSMAVLQPEVAMKSLMRKVKDGLIVQDTGTGGAYPVSSDRMIWVVAAWEIYKVTGDRGWLKNAYDIIKRSAVNDEVNLHNSKTGLVKGESSFLDWREQTYPRWMQPADIYESECLSTNAVHYRMYKVLADMAALFGDDKSANLYNKNASVIKKGINEYLWQEKKGYYGQYLYGRVHKTLSPRAETLGEALAVLFDIPSVSNQHKIIENTPTGVYGTPCIYPQIPEIPPYHNNAVWPFVESYWALAAAKAGNESSVLKSLSAIYRASGLFLTNKENFVASTGDFGGTEVNSSNMLWSLSGNIAMIYKVLFGISYNTDNLSFTPFIPKALSGKHLLKAFKYRDAELDISISGYGNTTAKVTLDGKPLPAATVPASLSGNHSINITLSNYFAPSKINTLPDYTSLPNPQVRYNNNTLSWEPILGAQRYQIMKNGSSVAEVVKPSYSIGAGDSEYQVIAIDKNNVGSFTSEPVLVAATRPATILQVEDYTEKSSLPYVGYSGKGFVNTDTKENTNIQMNVDVTLAGWYTMDVRYANGNGPINTGNTCAIRTIVLNGQFSGIVVLPHRGKGQWSNWGFSNSLRVKLRKGINQLSIQLKSTNTNMNIDVNQAMIDYVRLLPAL